ncbi:hypothetical protein CVT25_008574 [Psilocybe cyanescens]|uniref:DUF6535 domain-containing protein n=1 Tax=Psilocybe cyanescens TaxID=93625 RepID=A0A409XNK0_PSICY|nr:hypothetical protein CVT25_008574 [Psilocybe cyanescens]
MGSRGSSESNEPHSANDSLLKGDHPDGYTNRQGTSGVGDLSSRPQLPSAHSQRDANSYKSEFSQGFKIWDADEPYHHPIPKKDDPWDECFKLVLKFDEEMCRGWREEIDTLLVFAGLFSAAVTAFTIESYTWLQPDPQNAQVQLLQSISAQIRGPSSNVSTEIPDFSQNQFVPGASSIRVNIFWFTSLTLALISVLLGILCKQWLLRQLRYEGLLAWHVPTILSSLPLLLQAALILFFGGLIDLLWTINHQVASIVSVIVGIAMILLIGTTVAPCIQNLIHLSKLWPSHYREPRAQCAFKSPQSWAFYLLVTWIISSYSQLKQHLFYGTALNYLQLQLNSWHSKDANWVKYDYRWQSHGKFMQRGITWFDKTFARGHYNVEAIHNIYHCLASLETNISAECVSEIISANWNPLVPLVGFIQPSLSSLYRLPMEEDTDVDPILARDMVLAGYLVGHHKAGPSVSLYCLEQCTRMLNSPSLSKELSSVVLEILDIVAPTPVASQRTFIPILDTLGL